MANTFDAALVGDTFAEKAKTKLANVLAPLRAFTRDFSTSVYNQGQAHIVGMTTAGSTTLKNPTAFNAGNSTKVPISVTIDHYSQPFHVTSAELNQRHKLEDLADRNLQTFADSLLDVAMTPVTATNFTNISADLAQTAIAVTNLQDGWASVSKSPEKNLLLDGVAFSKFLPTSKDSFVPGTGAYGFNGMFLNTRWSGAGTGIYGMACGPDAICMAAGIPDIHPAVRNLMLESRVITLEGLGLSVQMNIWGDANTRAVWASYDVFFGAAFGGDVDAAYLFQNTP